MRKISFVIAAFLVFVVSCKKTDRNIEVSESNMIEEGRRCASQEVLEQQMAADPSLRERMNRLEEFTNSYKHTARINGRQNTIEVPVVIHVVYNTSTQNITDDQIAAQMQVLNEDFSMGNGDISKVPEEFDGVKASMNIQFTLAQVKREPTSKRSFGTNDAVKFKKHGGSDAVDPSKYLNIWVCNLGQNLLGYAQFPGGKPETDGVVVLYSSFGSRTKNLNGTYINNYDLGRTATHEIGHWINLRHIWGDATCGNDLVSDTPLHNTANTGCPGDGHKSTCTGTPLEMWMNYMDYTYDRCMYMFTAGQKTRADAAFTLYRPSFLGR